MNQLLRQSFWIAPLVSVLGFVSYFLVFVRFPALRDFPWLNLPLVLGALALAVWGTLHGWTGCSTGRRLLHLAGACVSLGTAALLAGYVFWLSYRMPPGNRSLGKIEDFNLPAADGSRVALSDYAGKRVLISFYRGYW